MNITEYVEGNKYYAMIYIAVTDDFDSYVGSRLENFGYITISNKKTNDSCKVDLFYDGISYFLNSKSKFIENDLKNDFTDKKLIKEIKRHLKYMRKKGYLK